MNTSTIRKTLERQERKVANMKKQLALELSKLSDKNEDITTISNSPHCFSISVVDMVKHDNWTPHFHSFQMQYETIIDWLMNCETSVVLDRIAEIREKGSVRIHGSLIRFHPDVVAELTEIG